MFLILLPAALLPALLHGAIVREKRQLESSLENWPDATVPYYFDDNTMSAAKKATMLKAMHHISSHTCVKFRPLEERDVEIGYVWIESNDDQGCSSSLGMQRNPPGQMISITDGCRLLAQSVHEVMHSLGIYHTHTRADRDTYVTVNSTGLSSISSDNFDTHPAAHLAVPYEYGSVLHYRYDSFYKDGLVVPKDPKYLYTMGNRRSPTFYDMVNVNTKFSCSCKAPLKCENGGYSNPSNCSECICPSGFGGVLCDGTPVNSTILLATESWQNYSLTLVQSTDQGLEFIEKIVIVRAPEDKTIQVEITEMEGLADEYGCTYNGMEIKYLGDPRITNPLHCHRANVSSVYTGKLNPMPVILYQRGDTPAIFGFRYRFLDQELSKNKRGTNGYDSYEYYL